MAAYWDSDEDRYYAVPEDWGKYEVPGRIKRDRSTLTNWRGHGQDEYMCRSFDLPGGRKIDVAQVYRASPGDEKWWLLVLENGEDVYAASVLEEVA